MTKDELIAKQQLELESLKAEREAMLRAFRDIHSSIFGIGGPLNGNSKKYSRDQIDDFCRIESISEYFLD